jgi:membrane protein implicated in regulation of membrane protease activity
MLTLYLMCLLLGGILIALSIFGGGDTDVDVDVAADVDVDVDVDIDADGGGVDGDGGEGLAAAARFLSMRNLVFFLAFFGLTGTLLTLLQDNHLATLLTAGGLGALAAFTVQRLMDYLRSSQSGALPRASALAGAEARVVVGLAGQRPGKVDVVSGDRTYQFVARMHEGAGVDHVEKGDTVVVVRIQDGIALVAEKSYLT